MLSEEQHQKLCKAAKQALEEAVGHACPDCIVEVREGSQVVSRGSTPAAWEVRAWINLDDYDCGDDPNIVIRGMPGK